MSEIEKIVKFTVIADQIKNSPEVIELKENDIIIVQVTNDTTYEEIQTFRDVFKSVVGEHRKLMVTFPLDIFKVTLEELATKKQYIKEMEKELTTKLEDFIK